MERRETDESDVVVAVRRRRHRHTARFTSQHFLSLCIGAFIVVRSSPPSSFQQSLVGIKPSELFSFLNHFDPMDSQFKMNRMDFQSRPVRLRHRDDTFLFGSFPFDSNFCSKRIACPLVTEDHSYLWTQGPSSSYSDSSAGSSSDDTDSWSHELRLQKRQFPNFVREEQYGCDLQNLTEKNTHESLTPSEVNAYQNTAKGLYAGFFSHTTPHRPLDNAQCSEGSEQSPLWPSTNEFLEQGDNTIAPVTFGSSYQNSTYLDLDNPILNNVTLSQSAQFLSSNDTQVLSSENAIFPLQNNTLFPDGLARLRDGEADQATVSILPTFTLGDSEFSSYCANEQVKEDISQSVLELSAGFGDSLFYSTIDLPSTSSNYSFSENQTQLCASSGASSTSSICQDDYSPNVEDSSSLSSAEETFSGSMVSRSYGKLYPAIDDDHMNSDCIAYAKPNNRQGVLKVQVSEKPIKSARGNRGRRSKDELLVAKFGLPATAHAISEMTLSEMQKISRSLTEEQKAMMKKIRRRGKNKVAARMCRQRKGMAPPSPIVPVMKKGKRGIGKKN